LIDPFVREKVSDIEQVARMLAVERSDHLSCIEVGEGDDRHFRKSKCLLDRAGNGPLFRLIDAATQNRSDLDFGLHASSADL
jgi:hypothetical protein